MDAIIIVVGTVVNAVLAVANIFGCKKVATVAKKVKDVTDSINTKLPAQ